jgi:hypothetical protein
MTDMVVQSVTLTSTSISVKPRRALRLVLMASRLEEPDAGG